MSDKVKAYLHVVYAGFGDASILEFESGGKHRFYLVDGGPISHVGAGGTLKDRIKEIQKPQLSKPYYQYLLYTLTRLASVQNSEGKEIKLDGAVVTHPHADHLDGAERLFRELLPHKYQVKVASDSPTKRLMCNGPVLLTRKFALQTEAYRSFSEFLLNTKFEISLGEDDIQNAFGGNDIFFTFPSSPGVLYKRNEYSKDEEPSIDEQRSKLKKGTEAEDNDLNKSSIIIYTEKGGKICLTGDAYGYDIATMLRKRNVKDLDIIKIPHHGSPENSILGTVLPPSWAIHNLASMLLLSIALRQQKVTFEKHPEEEDDIKQLREKLNEIAGEGNGEQVERVADRFLQVLTKRMKNTPESIPSEALLQKVQEKHMEIVTAIQQQSGKGDPCEHLQPLKHLEKWEDLSTDVVKKSLVPVPSSGSERSPKRRKIEESNVIKQLLSNDEIYRSYFKGKIGIESFFESFHAKTYYFSAEGRHHHPSSLVIKGIIKAAVKKKKPCRIVFTSGGCVPSTHLPDANSDPFKAWNKLVSLYYLKGDVSFKLDPSEDVNKVPSGTTKFEEDEKKRSDVAKQLKKNYGFTIPRRTFLPELDKYYVTPTISNIQWLQVNGDGTFSLTSTKSALVISNAPSINGDLRMITLKSDGGGETSVVLEKADNSRFRIKLFADGGYLFVEGTSLTEQKNKGTVFFFFHTTLSVDSKSGNQIPIMEFLKSVGYKGDGKAILVGSVLEMLLGVPNMKNLTEQLPSDFVAIASLGQEVDLKLSTVELSTSVDCEVASSHIYVMLPTPAMKFDTHDVTRLEIAVKDPSSTNPSLSLLMSTSLRDVEFTVNLNKHLKPREASVDMYLNALGGVPMDGRDNLTLGTLLDRVMGRLPLETLSNCFPSQLFEGEVLTWKVDRVISTVNYFISPLAVEVLSGDVYLIVPPEMAKITFGDTLTTEMSQIHVMFSDSRTYKSNFHIDCVASIGEIPVKVKLACTPSSLPEVVISFPETIATVDVFKTLGHADNLPELRVPFENEIMKNLRLRKPRISIVQDVRSSKVTRVSSVSFDFPFDTFSSVIPSSLLLPEDNKASVTILDPHSVHPRVGLEVGFKLPISSSGEDKSFLDSKFSLWPIQVSDKDSDEEYVCSISLSPSSSGITLQSALNAVIPGDLTTSMTTSFPCISSILDTVLLDQVTLGTRPQNRVINSVTVSLFVPEWTILKGKLSIYDANFFIEYANNQWYAEAETKIFVFNKFVCQAAFSLPRADTPGTLTFENTDDFTFEEFIKGIGVVVADDIPIVKEFLSLKISKVALSFEDIGGSLKLTDAVIVVEKRELNVGSIKLYNPQIEVTYTSIQDDSLLSFTLQGYLNPMTHASFAYNAEKRELRGHYQLRENVSTSDCLSELFSEETQDLSGGSAFDQVKSLQVQEVEVVVSFPRSEEWSLNKFVLSIQGLLSLGPFNLHNLRFEYTKQQAENIKHHYSVTGHFKSNDRSLGFVVELSCTNQHSEKNVLEATLRPDVRGGLKLSSLLNLIGLETPDVPMVDGSPNFLDIELKEALLQFEVPFRIRKLDVVIETNKTLSILVKPLIQLQNARLEYHLDQTTDRAETQVFIAGVFVIAQVHLEVRFMKDTKRGLILEGRLDHSEHDIVDFEKAAKQLSPGLAVNLPEGASVALSSFSFKLEKSEECTDLILEGESQGSWSRDAGFSTITVETLGGKLNFRKERTSDKWSGVVCLTGKVRLLQTVLVAVEVYYDSKRGTIVFGTVQNLEQMSLEDITRHLPVSSESSTSWNGLVSEETEPSVRSPHFKTASVYINFAEKLLLICGNVSGFGTGMLLVKKTSANEESPEYGFLFGLRLGSDFRFSSINKRLSVIDEILSVKQANLSVISLKNETIEELRKDFSKLDDLKGSSIAKHLDFDAPFADLDITSISKLNVDLRGMTAYAKISFSSGESKLLSNVTQIQRGETRSDVVLFAHLPENVPDATLMAQIGEMKLFGGSLSFNEVTLVYKPFVNKAFSLSGKMSLLLTEDSKPLIFHGSLEITESKAEFSMTVGGGPETIHKPFGMFGISFKQPKLKLTWQFDQDQHQPIIPVYSISGTVNFFKSASTSEEPAATLDGLVLFQGGKPVVATISLDLNNPLSIDDVFVTLFNDKWPKGYLDVKFKGGEIYYAKSIVELDVQDGKKTTYKEGFHGETHIQIFDYTFGVELTVDSRGMTVKGFTEFEIDLNIATLTQADEIHDGVRGPEIMISRYDKQTEFKMSAGIKLLQENIGSCSVGYSIQEHCFLGGVIYNGELLGIKRPSIEFEWSKKRGFRIRHLPGIVDLQALIDFAKAFEKLSEMIDSPCEKLVGMAFDKVIKTKCRLNVKQVSVEESQKPNAWFALELQGKLDIMIGVTDKPTMTVDFPKMIAAPDKPPKQFRLSDLKAFLVKEIVDNSLELVKQVFTQPGLLTKFFAALGAVKLSRKVLSGLICRYVTSSNVTTQAEIELDAMEAEAEALEAELESIFDELIELAEAVESTLTALAASAVPVIVKAGIVIGALVAIVGFIMGIITFFTGKSKQQKEAEERQKAAKQKKDQAIKSVEDRLVIKNLAITLPKPDEIEVTWNPLEKEVEYRVKIACIDLSGTEKTLKEETTKSSKVNVQNDAVKYNAKTFKVSVQAFYVHGDYTFTGNKQSTSVNAISRLRAPSKIEIQSVQEGRELHMTFSLVEYAENYKAEIVAHDGGIVGSAIIKNPEEKEGSHVFRAEELASEPAGVIKVRVCAQRDPVKDSLSDFKDSIDLYRVAAVSHFCHSYNPASQEVSVEWNVSDGRDISSYLCELLSVDEKTVVYSRRVAKPKNDNLKSIFQIHLDEIADKSKSPYQLRVCSLGSSTALASSFLYSGYYISFLPRVEGVSPSYDPQTNRLTVSWVLVTGATTYGVSIRANSSLSSPASIQEVDGHMNSAVIEMEKVELKVGLPYLVAVIADGSDSQHLRSMPSTASTEFTRLPSPSSIIHEYAFEETKIKVTFQSVPNAAAHIIEVFNENFPSQVAGSKVVPKSNTEGTYSFDVNSMTFSSGARFKSRVIAQGNANLINSAPCITATALTCSEAVTSVTLKYSIEYKQLVISFMSRPGNFIAKVEDTCHNGRTISTQIVDVKGSPKDKEKKSVRQSVLEIPLNIAKEPPGAMYQASLLNTGDHQHLPSGITQSNKVPLLDPPFPVEQQYKQDVFTVAWKCVPSASGYMITVYNSKSGRAALEASITRDLPSAGQRMKKEFDVDSLSLESNGAYQTLVQVLGNDGSIGGASAKSTTTIPSFSSPDNVKISFNNETRLMHVSCSHVKDAASFNLGVVNAGKLNNQDTIFQNALLGLKTVTVSSDHLEKPVEVEFDDRVLISSQNGMHKGVARLMAKQGDDMSLPSGYSISDELVSWLRSAVPIHMSFDPINSDLKIAWTSVKLALRYSIEVLQTRNGKNGATTTLVPFSDEVDSLSYDANIKDVKIEETDKFTAKIQPIGIPGTVITDHSIAYSSEALVCKTCPTQFEVLQVEDEAVALRWKGDETDCFQIRVWKLLESGDHIEVITEHTKKPDFKATAAALLMFSPCRYKFGVRAQGSIKSLHSVFTESDFIAVIIDAPVVNSLGQRPAVTVQWNPVENNPTQEFSNYVISYLQRDTESAWHRMEVELLVTEKTIDDLEPDSEYLFCVSVASSKRGVGIRSPPTSVHTSSVTFPSNLLENPNFAPAQDWDETGHTWNIVTHPWQLIQPTDKQYRLELISPGTKGLFRHEGIFNWFVQASRACCWRVQTIDLLAKGLTPEYLDEIKPDIKVFEWFSIKTGHSGTYDMKVSLLDINNKDLPGRNFYHSRQMPRSNTRFSATTETWIWDCPGHIFSNYPSGSRFIRFEDTMQSGTSLARGRIRRGPWKPFVRSETTSREKGLRVMGSAMKEDPLKGVVPSNVMDIPGYDVKAFGATVWISKSQDEKSQCRQHYSKECDVAVNKQINLELHASNAFLLMSETFVNGLDLIMQKYSDKAREHAQMLMQYQKDRGGDIVLEDIARPERDRWGKALEACETAMDMSDHIYQALVGLCRVALNSQDDHMSKFIVDSLIGMRGRHGDLWTELKLWTKEHGHPPPGHQAHE